MSGRSTRSSARLSHYEESKRPRLVEGIPPTPAPVTEEEESEEEEDYGAIIPIQMAQMGLTSQQNDSNEDDSDEDDESGEDIPQTQAQDKQVSGSGSDGSSDSGSDDEAGDDDNGSEEEATGSKNNTSNTPSNAEDSSTKMGDLSGGKKVLNVRTGVSLTLDEMVQNCVYYFLISQNKKIPLKRADLIKHAMNGQKKCFKEVITKFEGVLKEMFGMRLVGLEMGKSDFSSYIVISEYTNDVAEAVSVKGPENEMKRAILYLLLSVMFMQNRGLEEDMIWKLLTEMQFEEVCKEKRDLTKFLKQEYVMPMYFNCEEIKDTDSIVYRYSWGPRADKEFSKWAMLKFVASQFDGCKAEDFDFHFNLVRETERAKVEEDLAKQKEDAEAGKNGSALRITENSDGMEDFEIEGLPDFPGNPSQLDDIDVVGSTESGDNTSAEEEAEDEEDSGDETMDMGNGEDKENGRKRTTSPNNLSLSEDEEDDWH